MEQNDLREVLVVRVPSCTAEQAEAIRLATIRAVQSGVWVIPAAYTWTIERLPGLAEYFLQSLPQGKEQQKDQQEGKHACPEACGIGEGPPRGGGIQQQDGRPQHQQGDRQPMARPQPPVGLPEGA